MRISVGYQALTEEQRLILNRRMWIVNESKRDVRAASMAVERRVKDVMPVDTGRARASWGHWTAKDVRDNPDASSLDAVWEESKDGLSITQGTNLEYVEALNAGHSQQAPAGFLDAAEEAGQRELDRLIDDLMRDF